MNKFLKVLKNPDSIILNLMYRGYFNFLSDKLYLKMRYRLTFGKKLNLYNPQTFNEKLQWLKIYDRKNIYTIMVDKYEVKKYIKDLSIDGLNVIPTLGVYDKFDDIDFDRLPSSFVIKCTHDSGGLVIVKDKEKLDKAKAKIKINKSLKKNYYYNGREWPYKNVKPRIIVEKYLENIERDYRFYCFEGETKYIYSYVESENDLDKPEPEYCDIFDVFWNKQNFRQMCPPSDRNISKPKEFEMMKAVANVLSRNVHFLRVDFISANGFIYIGELTFYPGAGLSKFFPEDWDYKLGSFIRLGIEKEK